MELDRIHIVDLRVFGIVGIKADERITPQEILVNATLGVDSTTAAASDDIADAANYRTITKAMIDHIKGGRPMLVERLAQELVDVIFNTEPRVQAAELRLEKPGALRHTRSVGITICRQRV